MQEDNKHGALTASIGKQIAKELEPKGYRVRYDHGDKDEAHVGRITAWFGEGEPTRGNRLSLLDIAIIDKDGHAVVLVEIEETTEKPKVLLGDVFGTLLGDHVRFSNSKNRTKEVLEVGPQTTLLILGNASSAKNIRLEDLFNKIELVRSRLGTKNAEIGRIVFQPFISEATLKERILDCL